VSGFLAEERLVPVGRKLHRSLGVNKPDGLS